MTEWRCSVCGYVWKGDKPPAICPQCSSSAGEFVDLSVKVKLEVKDYDVLLINGSSHKSHNTAILVDYAEDELKKKGVTYARINLNELNVQHCWCCYSMADAACTYPCRNQLDDVPRLQEMLIKSKAMIVASPINWNNMSARLKDFLDRLTAIQNMSLLGRKNPTMGKVVGLLVDGHEDGAMKTAMDILAYFQQMGFIMAPFGFAYATHGAANNAKTDIGYFKQNEKLKKDITGMVNNVIEMVKLDLEKKLKDKLVQVCE